MNFITNSNFVDLANSARDVTASKLRSFLYELAEGVSNYRTVHSLTEQVQHQYHGRFAIELIQNAYDALARDPNADRGSGRIELRLVADRQFGTLHVANDGLPFSKSNFDSVSQLGQSDKSPETSIGNKGIGFRSVLEICDQPQIWSRRSPTSEHFDGYCFGFSPEFVRSLLGPVMGLIEEDGQQKKIDWLRNIIDWEESLLKKLRASVSRQAEATGITVEEWIRSQLGYLSPYLLPWPLQNIERVDAINVLEAKGFATIVALPLKSATSAELVKRRLAEVNAHSLLFLDHLKELTLFVGGQSRTFTRRPERIPTGPRHYGEVAISSSELTMRFRTWRREIMVSDMPAGVRASILELPGLWPKLKKVEISLAVASSREPEPGQLSIFLPTKLESGAAVNVNAPFFGDMSRTLVNFGDATGGVQGDAVYNDYLLGRAADLAIEAIVEDLQGKAEAEAADIVDLLAPNASDDISSERWLGHLRGAVQARGIQIENAAWFLSDRGWSALSKTSLLPLAPEPKVLTAQVMRQHAVFPAYAAALDGRSKAIKNLSAAHKINVFPSTDDQAETIENAVAALQAGGPIDWRGFWRDVLLNFATDLTPLKARKVLLCTDGNLHAGGISGSAIYFKPRQAGPENEQGSSDPEIDQIPQALRHLIAILDPVVPVSELRQGRPHNTELHGKLTAAGLVEQFRREDVLSKVLIPNLPALPVKNVGPEADLCRDALSYGIRLVQSMQVRGEGLGALKAMAKLAVPCRGGWFQLEAASFGSGWAGTQGSIVDGYLKRCATASARYARDRLLRSPEHPGWTGLGRDVAQILRDAGVHDGLRLARVKSNDWPAKFAAKKFYFELPETSPELINRTTWGSFRDAAREEAQPRYNDGTYEIGEILWIPGLEGYSDFDEATRSSFFEVVLASAARWGKNWQFAAVNRVEGSPDYFTLRSPLFIEMKGLHWIAEQGDEGLYSATIRMRNRVASSRNVPERLVVASRRMLLIRHRALWLLLA